MGNQFSNKRYNLVSLKLSQDLSSPEIQRLNDFCPFSTSEWVISYGKFQSARFAESFHRCSEIRISILQLDYNSHPNIIMEISSVRWVGLQVLSLKDNLIENLEGILWLEVPQLTHIVFDCNKICSLAPLRKTKIPKLISLSFTENCLNSFSTLKQLQLQKQLGGRFTFLSFGIDSDISERNPNINQFQDLHLLQPIEIGLSAIFLDSDTYRYLMSSNSSSLQRVAKEYCSDLRRIQIRTSSCKNVAFRQKILFTPQRMRQISSYYSMLRCL